MADSVVKLRVDSSEYDSKIKRAAQNVLAFGENCQKAGQSMAKADKEAIDYVRSIGQMETVSKNAKGKINEMTNAFTDLSVQYKRLTDEEKASPFGQALSQSLDHLKGRINEDKRALAELNRELEINADVVKQTGGNGGAMGQIFNGVAGQFGLSTSMLTGVGAAVAGAGLAFRLAGDNIRTALNFEESISQLSSLTGKTGKELDELKEYAIELGSTTTLSASQVADAFKMIGSQQPQLLASGEALRDVTKAAITLSEAAGIELATAAQSLSTSINQFGGDSSNAARFVNVLAAASQKGAGDISFLGEAISKSGVLANAVGASYEELVANLEQLAQAGMDASTSGTALRSIIANLEKQSNNEYKPSVVGLTQAFENLGKAHLSVTDYVSIAGKQFFSQAMILADNAEKARELTKEITGTNTAEEQASTNTNNLAGSIKSLQSAWEGLNLTINDSNGFLKISVDFLADIVHRYTLIIKKLQELRDKAVGLFGGEDSPFGGGAGSAGGGTGGGVRGGGEVETDTTTPVGGGLAKSKKGGKTKSKKTGTHKLTDAEKAQQIVDAALVSYAETIKKADLTMEAGLDNTLAHQKKELQAQSSLMDAYARAIAVHDDPKYRASYTEAADKYKLLAKTIADTEEEAKKTKEWFREAEKQNNSVINMGGEPESMAHIAVQNFANSKMDADLNALKNLMKIVIEEGIKNVEIPADYLKKQILGITEEGIPQDVSDKFWKNIIDTINAQQKASGRSQYEIDYTTGEVKKKDSDKTPGIGELTAKIGKLTDGIGSITTGLEQLGIKIPDGLNTTLGVIQSLITVINGVQSVISIFASTSQTANTVAVTANTAAVAALTTAMATNTISNFIPFFAGGGIMRAASGLVGGNYMSGDNVGPVMVDSGELILNRAQQGNIASQLEGGAGTIQLEARLYGEDIVLATRNVDRRRGKGEVVRSR